jgi:Icc-related predicted phosphoesterase
MRLVLISDTHCRHDFKIPEGDVLVHAGDLTMMGSLAEVTKVAAWLKDVRTSHKFQHVLVAPGNHDWMAERDPALIQTLMQEAGCTYLHHQSHVIDDLKFFLSGYSPRFYDWALNVDRGPALAALWSQIPEDTNVLVTHGPPYGRRDACRRGDDEDYGTLYGGDIRYKVEHVGCRDLSHKITELKALRLHVFGHIHHQYGHETGADGIIYANASICDSSYWPSNEPIVVDLEPKAV